MNHNIFQEKETENISVCSQSLKCNLENISLSICEVRVDDNSMSMTVVIDKNNNMDCDYDTLS